MLGPVSREGGDECGLPKRKKKDNGQTAGGKAVQVSMRLNKD
jgi:hypothetical protein